uniref:Calpain catalytic domain-containing protein n=1 Tax=Pseudonaja textilis TaxID=8673 RepID=A0A670ZBR9_PSETE
SEVVGAPSLEVSKKNWTDFVKLQNYCLHQGLLFEDDTFPANGHSIGLNLFPQEKLRKIQWLRPNVSSDKICALGISVYVYSLYGNYLLGVTPTSRFLLYRKYR